MGMGKKVTFLIGNGAEIRPLEIGRKGPEDSADTLNINN